MFRWLQKGRGPAIYHPAENIIASDTEVGSEVILNRCDLGSLLERSEACFAGDYKMKDLYGTAEATLFQTTD